MITFTFEDIALTVEPGTSIAAALIAQGDRITRLTRFNSSPRGIFCGIGVCFDCLIEVNGISNQRSCITEVQEGMVVRMQHGG